MKEHHSHRSFISSENHSKRSNGKQNYDVNSNTDFRTPTLEHRYEGDGEDSGKTGAKGGFPVMNEDKSLVGPWNAMVASPMIGSLAERMGNYCGIVMLQLRDLYEIGILVVGARWRSQFEWFAHEKLAKKAGVSEEAIQGIKSSRSPEDMNGIMSEDQKAVYKYATELHDRTRVSNETHEDALKAVGSERALIDLVFTMGFYHQISMTLNAFNVPLPSGEELPFDEEETDDLT